MAARTYQPTLRHLAQAAARFTARYQALLLAGMTSEQAIALTAFIEACNTLIAQLGTGGGV